MLASRRYRAGVAWPSSEAGRRPRAGARMRAHSHSDSWRVDSGARIFVVLGAGMLATGTM